MLMFEELPLGLPAIINQNSDGISSDLMNMMFWVLLIMIIILVVLIIFISLVLLWLKRQQKLRFPVKSKVIMRKERTLARKLPGSAAIIRAVDGSGVPKAKPAQAVVISSKVAAVTPIRIATYQQSTEHNTEKGKDNDEIKEAMDDKKSKKDTKSKKD